LGFPDENPVPFAINGMICDSKKRDAGIEAALDRQLLHVTKK